MRTTRRRPRRKPSRGSVHPGAWIAALALVAALVVAWALHAADEREQKRARVQDALERYERAVDGR